jgi:hypothetical protein
MILRFFPQPDSPHSQIFRKVGQKKAEPNRPLVCSLEARGTDQYLKVLEPVAAAEMLLGYPQPLPLNFSSYITFPPYCSPYFFISRSGSP